MSNRFTPRRLRPLVLPALFACLVLTAFAALPQRDMSQVVIKGAHVGGKVHFLLGQGSNIGVSAGEDGVLVIDTQFAPLAEKIEAGIAKISKEPLRFVLNTHWHGDHTGGNPHFGAMATLIAHTNVRRRLAGDRDIGGRVAKDTPAAGMPVVTFEDSIALHFNGEDILLRHFPSGHTDGDTVVFFKGSNVVHMGDLYFAGAFPFIDLDSGGSVDGYLAAVGAVLQSVAPKARIIPGHGAVTGVKELTEWRTALSDCRLLVKDALESGLDAEAMKADQLLQDYDWMGRGFVNADRFIDMLVRDLSQ